MKIIGIFVMPAKVFARKIGDTYALENGRYLIIVDGKIDGVVISKSENIIPIGLYKGEMGWGIWIDVLTNNVVNIKDFNSVFEVMKIENKSRTSGSKRNRRTSRGEIQE